MLLEIGDPEGPPDDRLVDEQSSKAKSAVGTRKTGANTMPLGTKSRQREAASSDDTQDDSITRQHDCDDGIKIRTDQAKIEESLESCNTSSKKQKNKKSKTTNVDWAYSPSRSPPEKYICKRCDRPGE